MILLMFVANCSCQLVTPCAHVAASVLPELNCSIVALQKYVDWSDGNTCAIKQVHYIWRLLSRWVTAVQHIV